jgi:tRNA (guanine37-N1)-methyltransferase
MRFDILTIFPDWFRAPLSEGVMGRAIKKGIIETSVVNVRDFARDSHHTTDDRPYGGGDGMVMKPGPIFRALEAIERVKGRALVILLSPQGKSFDQKMAWKLAGVDQLIFICGRYEGVDERVRIGCVDLELSIGDYVMSGGELAAMVVMDTVGRLIPGVLGSEGSNLEDSFEGGLLEYPQYTRPRDFKGYQVPEILLSGDHDKIRKWRRAESLKRTVERRPDLLEKAELTDTDKKILDELKIKDGV